MNTYELRIGNIVNHKGRFITIQNISFKSVNLTFDKQSYKVVDFIPAIELEPLKITSRLLLILGFKNMYQRFKHDSVEKFYLTRVQDDFFLTEGSPENRIIIVKYVHQLQNIIYDYSGVVLKFIY